MVGPVESAGHTANAMEMIGKNAYVTAGVVIGSGTALAGGALLTATLPAQMLTATALTGGLIYTGYRKEKNLPLNPFAKDDQPQPKLQGSKNQAAPKTAGASA